jgi:hypothetical protein
MVTHIQKLKQINNFAEQVKDYMIKNGLYFIRNNERIRKKLGMNHKELAWALQHLNKIGFLEPWNKKIYQISHN